MSVVKLSLDCPICRKRLRSYCIDQVQQHKQFAPFRAGDALVLGDYLDEETGSHTDYTRFACAVLWCMKENQ